MKKIILGLLAGCLLVFVGACGENENKQIENTKQGAIEETQNYAKSTADIRKSGVVDNAILETEKYSIKLLSWDLGYTKYRQTKEKEVLCMKFHVTNNSNEQITIREFFKYKIFLDGVQMTSYYCDFYGDNKAYNVTEGSELRGNSETDVYICVDCSINDSHKLEIDLLEEYSSEEILDTWEFSIPENAKE